VFLGMQLALQAQHKALRMDRFPPGRSR
jgi:hypothetical protein